MRESIQMTAHQVKTDIHLMYDPMSSECVSLKILTAL